MILEKSSLASTGPINMIGVTIVEHYKHERVVVSQYTYVSM